MIAHRDVCRRKRGGDCNCCPACGDHRYAFKDRRCLTCFPAAKDAPVVKLKQKVPLVKSSGALVPIKQNSRSRAADAKRRERLYAEAMGLPVPGEDNDIDHA